MMDADGWVIVVSCVIIFCAVFWFIVDRYLYRKCPPFEVVVPILPIRLFNLVGSLVWRLTGYHIIKISYEELKDQYESSEWEEGFGPRGEELQHLKLVVDAFDNAPYTEFGRLTTKIRLSKIMEHRREVISYVKAHPEVMEIPIRHPLVIVGMHRSGTTFLSRLLALDPAARTLTMWEQLCNVWPSPPDAGELEAAKEGRGTRVEGVMKDFEQLHKLAIGGDAFRFSNCQHYLSANIPEEDLLVLFDAMFFSPFELSFTAPCREVLEASLRSDNKANAVLFLKRFLQLMSSGCTPKSHWLLKNPFTSLYMPTFIKEFPDARFVVCHRTPHKAVPSMARFHTDVDALRADWGRFDIRDLGRAVCDIECTVASRIATFWASQGCQQPFGGRGVAAGGEDGGEDDTDTEAQPQHEGCCAIGGNWEGVHPITPVTPVAAAAAAPAATPPPPPPQHLHLHMTDIASNPIGTVERIYAYLGYGEVSPQFRAAMETYLAQNGRYAHGRVTYDLDMFDLTPEDVDVPEYSGWWSGLELTDQELLLRQKQQQDRRGSESGEFVELKRRRTNEH